MGGLEPGQVGAEDANEEARELPEEAAFMRKVLEYGDCKISVDCFSLERYIVENVRDPETQKTMRNRLAFIVVEMDPALRPQALIQFFQTYYTQFSWDLEIQRMIDFILNFQKLHLTF